MSDVVDNDDTGSIASVVSNPGSSTGSNGSEAQLHEPEDHPVMEPADDHDDQDDQDDLESDRPQSRNGSVHTDTNSIASDNSEPEKLERKLSDRQSDDASGSESRVPVPHIIHDTLQMEQAPTETRVPVSGKNGFTPEHKIEMGDKTLNCDDDIGSLRDFQDKDYRKKGISKYANAMKTLIPIRCIKKNKENVQNHNLGLFSYISINWMDKWMWEASRRGVNPDRLGNVNDRESVYYTNKRLSRLWDLELEKHGPEKASLVRAVWRFNRFPLALAALMMLLTSVLAFLGPAWILKDLLDYLSEDEPVWYGVLLVLEMSLSQFMRNATFNCLWVIGAHAGIWAQGAVQVLVYDKVLRIKSGGERLLAEVVNYSTTDIERIYQSMQLSMMIVGAPVMWILNVIYCYLLLGPWSLLGNFIILCYYPIMAMVGRKTSALRVKAVRITDSRIRLMNQVLSSIKLIKMYAWEKAFSGKIKDIRKREETTLHKAAFLQSMSWTGSPILTVIAPMASFIGMVLTDVSLASSQAFSVASVFTSLLLPMNILPMAVKSFSEGLVSCRRIQAMLLSENATLPSDEGIVNPHHAINIVNADIGWHGVFTGTKLPQKTKTEKLTKNKQKKGDGNVPAISPQAKLEAEAMKKAKETHDNIEVLHDVNLIVEKGQLIGICGNVGTGKSTLLSAVTGDASLFKGNVSRQGRIAFVTQQAWIFNATVRENILFGLPFDEVRYKMVVFSCCLETDFTLMPHGDLTEIGERGANLSGGQKQRINLARALYSNREIFLLDDALSAVDVKVAKHIFDHFIQRALKANGKTVLLVTHAMHLLEQCDYILLMKEGIISERGTHQELIDLGKEYAVMFHTDQEERGKKKGDGKGVKTGTDEDVPEPDEAPMVDTGMIKQEIDLHTSLTWKTWLYYCKNCGGYLISIFAFLTIVFFNLASIFNSIWLQTWMNAGSGCDDHSVLSRNACANITDAETRADVTLNEDLHMYVGVYGGSAILMIIFGLIKGLTVGKVLLTGASSFHHLMFWKVIRSPMSFFDVTPLGRIIARFSRDMDELDVQIPFVTEFCSQSLMMIGFQLILIGVYLPWYLIALAVILVVYFTFDIMLNGGVRATKRVDNLLRPPLLVHLQATVQGIPVIRCYQKQKMMAEKFRKLVNKHLAAYLLFQLSSKWIAFRIDTLSWLVITATGFLIVFTKGTIDPSAAGLCMSQIFRVCAVLANVTRWKSELMARLISIERVAEYCTQLKEEAPSIIDKNRPKKEWPENGAIAINQAELKYRPDLPLVLHKLTVDIKGGEKVGIIGRTGAGKSSVIGTLLRLTELCGGNIVIDELDISKMGLEDLRSKIAVIPQEPVLFEGTIRWNLDPFNVRSEEEMWAALAKSHLKDKIAKEPAKLDTQLDAEGGIFSLGEKQLFCLSRALLRNSKILLLDEATASVDVETDRLIQATIRDSFKACTVLTIAHRLNTISDYEKIMTMDAGEVVEFDSPQNLLAKDSIYQSMMKSMNESGGH